MSADRVDGSPGPERQVAGARSAPLGQTQQPMAKGSCLAGLAGAAAPPFESKPTISAIMQRMSSGATVNPPGSSCDQRAIADT
jgi:hypothetical protein